MTAEDLELHADVQEVTASKTSASKAVSMSSFAFPTVEIEHVEPQEWDRVAAAFADIIPEQTGAFNCGHWGKQNIECVKFRTRSELIGGAVLIVRKLPFTGTGIAVLKWGPVAGWVKDFDENQYMAMIRALEREYCDRRNMHLTIIPAAIPELSEQTSAALIKLGFTEGPSIPDPERYLVKVDQEPQEILASLDAKWRYNLKKARENQFDIWFEEGADGLSKFLELYRKMLSRKQFFDVSRIASLEECVRQSHETLKPRVLLVSHEGELTAGGVFFIGAGLASYMFGATDDRAISLRAGYALHWWVAEYLSQLPGVKWYDLGGNASDAGLHQFKKGMVGKAGRIVLAPPFFQKANRLSAKFCGNAIHKAREILSAAKRMTKYSN